MAAGNKFAGDQEATAQAKPRRPILAVLGPAELTDDAQNEIGLSLGRKAVDAGFRVVTGGMGGMMAAISEGAHRSNHYREGDVLGIIPSYNLEQANPWVDIVIPTGMQLARNILVVSSADVVIGVGGGSGTLSELALAWQLAKPLIVILGLPGWADRLSEVTLDKRNSQPIKGVNSVEQAIEEALLCLQSANIHPGDVGSGWRLEQR